MLCLLYGIKRERLLENVEGFVEEHLRLEGEGLSTFGVFLLDVLVDDLDGLCWADETHHEEDHLQDWIHHSTYVVVLGIFCFKDSKEEL